MAVEKMQGISRLEQFVEELSEEERAKELKQEKKRQKRKNRRKTSGSLECVDGSCKACGSNEEEEEAGSEEGIATNGNTSCSCPDNNKQAMVVTMLLFKHGGQRDGIREGSDIACSEGICNHDEAGDDPNAHHCAEDKEEDGTDSCLDCWQHTEGTLSGRIKKEKEGKGLCNDQAAVDNLSKPEGSKREWEAM
ncbi:hypothetical protein INR49_026173 [Caranx melampygus]|nr:hypothetical protein INR49_026173 [Caranx melampygus]